MQIQIKHKHTHTEVCGAIIVGLYNDHSFCINWYIQLFAMYVEPQFTASL